MTSGKNSYDNRGFSENEEMREYKCDLSEDRGSVNMAFEQENSTIATTHSHNVAFAALGSRMHSGDCGGKGI